jgi:predicted 3-demethylubiquinone-9 3-methyltransferase (glyoxalase superfamily)
MKEATLSKTKITPFLWFDKEAEDAANFYVSIFRNAKINQVARYPEGQSVRSGHGHDRCL